MKCLICGLEFQQITSSHMKNKHGITLSEYKIRFPDAETMSQDTRKFLGDKYKKQNIGFKKGHKTNVGKIPWNNGLTAENNISIFKGAQKLQGRLLSADTKYKISLIAKEQFKTGKRNVSGSNNGMFGKKLSEKHRLALHQSQSTKKTKPEIDAELTLKQFGFRYSGDRTFWVTFKNGRHKNPDFVNSKTKMVVEIFGRYWHPDPNEKEEIISLYKEIGWTCYVVYDDEFFNPDVFNEMLGEFVVDDFKYEDFNGQWMN